VGPGHARTLIFLERAAIGTTVFPRAYMVLCSELRGEKKVGLKPFLSVPTIAYFHKVIAKGNM
jgi:hypothetical protein